MCGVFGIRAADRDVARVTYFGLFALQHRGQESAGIAVSDEGRLTVLRDMGLVTQVFDEQKLQRPARRGRDRPHALLDDRLVALVERAAARPARARAHGRARPQRQPHQRGGAARGAARPRASRSRSTSDTEVIAALIANDDAPLDEAVAAAMRRLEGAYSVVALSSGTLIAFRDPHGFRPLVLGAASTTTGSSPPRRARSTSSAPSSSARSSPASWCSSTRTALRSVQAVEPAERRRALHLRVLLPRPPRHAARGVEVHGARVRMGERLAAEAPVDADLVLPIPDSGTPAAIGFSRAPASRSAKGLIKNRYVGRTFIQPDQELREQGIRLKFNPLAEVAGKRVVVVDDSIVRGNTTRQIVQMLFDAGAAEVHVRISSPPVIGQCFYGIDLADEDEMIASDRTVEEIREHIGATSLAYLSLEGLSRRRSGRQSRALPRLPHAATTRRRSRASTRSSGSSRRAA